MDSDELNKGLGLDWLDRQLSAGLPRRTKVAALSVCLTRFLWKLAF